MRDVHEVNRAWRGARWDRRVGGSRSIVPGMPTLREVRRRWQAWGLAVLLGVALGVTITHGLARQDRAQLEALMSRVQAGR